MTKEEIIEMAKEVNLPYFWESGMPCNLEALKSFATLVAEKATAELRADIKINQRNLWQKLTRGQE